eukprot:Clim_evm16s157 gene=Clim_evmTU16s157
MPVENRPLSRSLLGNSQGNSLSGLERHSKSIAQPAATKRTDVTARGSMKGAHKKNVSKGEPLELLACATAGGVVRLWAVDQQGAVSDDSQSTLRKRVGGSDKPGPPSGLSSPAVRSSRLHRQFSPNGGLRLKGSLYADANSASTNNEPSAITPRKGGPSAAGNDAGPVNCIAWSNNGQVVASVGGSTPGIALNHCSGVLLVRILPEHFRESQLNGAQNQSATNSAQAPLSVAWSPDATQLVTAGPDNYVRLWDARKKCLAKEVLCSANGTEEEVAAAKDSCVYATFFVMDPRLVAFGTSNGHVGVINTATGMLQTGAGKNGRGLLATPQFAGVVKLATSPSRRNQIAVVDERGHLNLYDTALNKLLGSVRAHNAPCTDVSYGPTAGTGPAANCLATAGLDRTVLVWDPSTVKGSSAAPLLRISCQSPATALALHTSGVACLVGTLDGSILSYDLRNPSAPLSTVTSSSTTVTATGTSREDLQSSGDGDRAITSLSFQPATGSPAQNSGTAGAVPKPATSKPTASAAAPGTLTKGAVPLKANVDDVLLGGGTALQRSVLKRNAVAAAAAKKADGEDKENSPSPPRRVTPHAAMLPPAAGPGGSGGIGLFSPITSGPVSRLGGDGGTRNIDEKPPPRSHLRASPMGAQEAMAHRLALEKSDEKPAVMVSPPAQLMRSQSSAVRAIEPEPEPAPEPVPEPAPEPALQTATATVERSTKTEQPPEPQQMQSQQPNSAGSKSMTSMYSQPPMTPLNEQKQRQQRIRERLAQRRTEREQQSQSQTSSTLLQSKQTQQLQTTQDSISPRSPVHLHTNANIPTGHAKAKEREQLHSSTAHDDSAVVESEKSATTPSAGEATATTASGTGALDAQLLRSLVDDSIDELRWEVREDVQNLHVDMLRQMAEVKDMLSEVLRQATPTSALLAELAQLREENKRLRGEF